MSTSTMRNWFHAHTKNSTASVVVAGIEIGSSRSLSTRRSPAPSMRPDSTSSRGTVLKCVCIQNTPNGRNSAISASAMPR